MLTDDVCELIEAAAMYEKGCPPVAGGQLDQCKGFIEGCRFLWNEQAHLKAALKVF